MNSQSTKEGDSKGNDSNTNFHVCIRIRPTSSPSFDNQGSVEGVKYIRAGPENSILLVQPHSTQGDKVFIYDEVFDNKSQTKQIFEKVVLPNISDSLFKGFSHTILVYGMTGAGKTFTMFGENFEESAQTVTLNLGSQTEINNRVSINAADQEIDGPLKKGVEQVDDNDCKGGLVSETVKYVLQIQSQSKKVKLKMSYLEIYNESIRDLLSTETLTSENLMILEDPDKGVYCPLLSEKEIQNLDQITSFIKSGNRRRVMASTKLNQFSSRSHAIIQLSIEIELDNNGKTTTYLTPKLYMVDLAGSERAAATESKGVRFKEGANINKSLLSLGNCITVLSTQGEKGKKHVPYRDSKLTRLLKESLGGNAKTLFIACVTPAFKFVEETINTLKYAQRAKSIHKDVYENVKQIYNQIEKNEAVKEMHVEIENLKELLQQQQNDLLGIQNDNLNLDEETLKQLQGISTDPPTEEQVVGSIQFKSHRQLFSEQFKRLSDHFEDILFRNRELEFNLAEYNQSREQNERLVHEIMDTINPAALTQKEMKYRLDKVNTLRTLIKNNEEVIIKLQKELQDNDTMKNTIKKELEDLYDVKFIQECQQLTNFQLVSTFEQEKKRLKEEINQLLQNQQQQRDEEQKKEQQIKHLKDEINFIKKKATASEIQLQQSQLELQKGKGGRGRGKHLTVRASSIVPGTKITPRNVSQKEVPSKYLNFQTFVPSSNISVNTVREKSMNIRQSMIGPSRKSDLQDNNNSQGVVHQVASMYDVNMSPTSREFEEYKRKELIIESQLKNMQKNSSSKNVQSMSASKTFYEVGSSSTLGQPYNNSSSQIYQSPNRQSNHLIKSSFKSSFIDLAPQSGEQQHTHGSSYDNSNGKNSYDMNRDSSEIELGTTNSINPHDYLRGSELTHQQYQKIIQSKNDEEEQIKRSSFNVDNSSQKSSGSSNIANQFVSPKPISKVKQQYGLSSSGSSSAQHSKTLSKHHSKNPSYQSADEKQSSSSGGLKNYSGMFTPIIESHQEQSVLNMTGIDNTPTNNMQNNNNKPKESRFFLENNSSYQQSQNELLNPSQNFLFISQSQLVNPQLQQQFDSRNSYVSNSNYDYSNKNTYQSPLTSTQKSTTQSYANYSSQKTPQQQIINNKNPMNNKNNSSSTNSSQSSNDYNKGVSNYSTSTASSQPAKNSISSLYYSSGSQVSMNQSLNPPTYPQQIASTDSTNNAQQQQQAKISKPSFNSYIQNSATYGAVNQLMQAPPPTQNPKVPTTAITLNLGMKN